MIYFLSLRFIGKCLSLIWAHTTRINTRIPIFKTDLEINIVFIRAATNECSRYRRFIRWLFHRGLDKSFITMLITISNSKKKKKASLKKQYVDCDVVPPMYVVNTNPGSVTTYICI